MPDASTRPVVAIVDPISTGASLAKFLSNLGYPLVRVFSDTLPDEVKALVAEGLEVDWQVTIQHEGPGRAAYTAAALRGLGVKDVIVGSEPGVSLQAELSSAFGQPVCRPSFNALTLPLSQSPRFWLGPGPSLEHGRVPDPSPVP